MGCIVLVFCDVIMNRIIINICEFYELKGGLEVFVDLFLV